MSPIFYDTTVDTESAVVRAAIATRSMSTTYQSCLARALDSVQSQEEWRRAFQLLLIFCPV